jgi:hypothetical protein
VAADAEEHANQSGEYRMRQANPRTALNEPATTVAFRNRRRETRPMNDGANRAYGAPAPAELCCADVETNNLVGLLNRISAVSQMDLQDGNKELSELLYTPGFLALLATIVPAQIQIIGTFFSSSKDIWKDRPEEEPISLPSVCLSTARATLD